MLGRDNIYSLLSNIVFSLFGFVSFLLLVRTVPTATFGQWVLFISVASLMDMLRLGLTGTAAIKMLSAPGQSSTEQVLGASYQLGIAATAVAAAVFAAGYLAVQQWFPDSIYRETLLYYPLLACANLAFHQAQVAAQGRNDFRRLFHIRLVAGALSLGSIAWTVFSGHTQAENIIQAYTLAYAGASVLIVASGWDGARYLSAECRLARIEILQFGKYSTAGYIGSNLLRSSDTLLLSMFSFMGAEAISLLAVPFKFVEVVEIPLRSFASTAYPRFARALQDGVPALNASVLSYTVGTTLMLMPFVALLAAFSGFFLHLIGGSSFQSDFAVQQEIVYAVCAYILILPLDRFSGVALFAMNRPELNFYKISIMLVANILFDLIAIIVFKSVVLVAVATLIFTILGVYIGWMFYVRENKRALTSIPLPTNQ